MTDFHSHILPAMDDGAADISVALAMLQKLKQDGVTTVVATPHFYRHKEDITSFLTRRNQAYDALMEAIVNMELPRIVLGAEVYFSPSLAFDDDLEKLCISGTRYLLLEMPYMSFSKSMLDSLRSFVNAGRVFAIMAHCERYLAFTSAESVNEMLSLEVLGQVNCESVARFSGRKGALELIKSGSVHVLGTDAHDMTDRPPLFAEAGTVIRKKLSDEHLQRLLDNAERILSNCSPEEILD